MKQFTFKKLALAIAGFLVLAISATSCKKDSIESGSSGGPKKNVIQGNIYDAHGHKFHIDGATAEVHIYGTGTIGETDPSYVAKMDVNGHYEIQVANNVYAVN